MKTPWRLGDAVFKRFTLIAMLLSGCAVGQEPSLRRPAARTNQAAQWQVGLLVAALARANEKSQP
jgi:hypothetical protein